jgi:hypothetical protein
VTPGACQPGGSNGDRVALLIELRVLRSQRRQLQNSRNLTRPQSRQENDLPVGELERIMMGMRLISVDLAKLSDLSGCFLSLVKKVESRLIFHALLEGEFGAWK